MKFRKRDAGEAFGEVVAWPQAPETYAMGVLTQSNQLDRARPALFIIGSMSP